MTAFKSLSLSTSYGVRQVSTPFYSVPYHNKIGLKNTRLGRSHLINYRASFLIPDTVICAQKSSAPRDEPGDDSELEGSQVFTEDEDWEVPGGPNDSLSSNTPLGRAVRSACEELETLNAIESDVLGEADSLLRKLGYKGGSLAPPKRSGGDQ
uniref:Uncharacterized protein n=1 Tax=Tetraselmis sp. GSL018 TaxID=582737 RepID=A0A061SH60_9CHLO|mmetsp:Transcript_33454/g.79353  ORF Transcript_33454/g.79353 Transcript_33454/m.79353 type:complete len:153 (+) Transcript_33454:107-565(+)